MLSVGPVLGREPLPARQRHDPRRDAVGLECVAGGDGDLHLRAGAHQDDLGGAAGGLGQHVTAPGDALCRPELRAVEHGQVLAGQRESGRAVVVLECPIDRTKRWRPSQFGSLGSWLNHFWNSR